MTELTPQVISEHTEIENINILTDLTVEFHDYQPNGDFGIALSHSNKKQVSIGFSTELTEYYIDRTNSGEVSFQEDFANRDREKAQSINESGAVKMRILIDQSSIELFSNDGVTVLTALIFPTELYNTAYFYSLNGSVTIKEGTQNSVSGIW